MALLFARPESAQGSRRFGVAHCDAEELAEALAREIRAALPGVRRHDRRVRPRARSARRAGRGRRRGAAVAVLTVGHSNHPLEKFLAILKAHRVERVLDVRRFPASRKWPHFNAGRLARRFRRRASTTPDFPSSAAGARRGPTRPRPGGSRRSGATPTSWTRRSSGRRSIGSWRWQRRAGRRSCAPRRCPGAATARSSRTPSSRAAGRSTRSCRPGRRGRTSSRPSREHGGGPPDLRRRRLRPGPSDGARRRAAARRARPGETPAFFHSATTAAKAAGAAAFRRTARAATAFSADAGLPAAGARRAAASRRRAGPRGGLERPLASPPPRAPRRERAGRTAGGRGPAPRAPRGRARSPSHRAAVTDTQARAAGPADDLRRRAVGSSSGRGREARTTAPTAPRARGRPRAGEARGSGAASTA